MSCACGGSQTHTTSPVNVASASATHPVIVGTWLTVLWGTMVATAASADFSENSVAMCSSHSASSALARSLLIAMMVVFVCELGNHLLAGRREKKRRERGEGHDDNETVMSPMLCSA